MDRNTEAEGCWFHLDWFTYLKLPLLVNQDWSRECALYCDFEREILEHLTQLEVWVNTAEQKFTDQVKNNPAYQQLLSEKRRLGTVVELKCGYEPKLRRQLVAEVLQSLATQTNETVARDFENWLRMYLFSSDFTKSLRDWWTVLLRLRPFRGSSPGHRERWYKAKVQPPPYLEELAPEIERLLKQNELVNEMRRNAPIVPVNDQGAGITKARCVESLYLSFAAGPVVKFRALQFIANHLNESEIQGVVAWAEAQSAQLRSPDSRKLHGARYILKTLPRFEGISVFDIPEEELTNYAAHYLPSEMLS